MAMSATDLRALWRDAVAYRETCQSMSASLSGLLDAVQASNDASTSGPVNVGYLPTIQTARNTLATLMEGANGIVNNLHPLLGEFAGSTTLNNELANLALFNDYLQANSEAVQSRGLSKFASMTPGSGNVGSGDVAVLDIDQRGQEIDIAHVGDIVFRCVRDANAQGVLVGNEVFNITGSPQSLVPWAVGGIGAGNAYGPRIGFGFGATSMSLAIGSAVGSTPLNSGADQSNAVNTTTSIVAVCGRQGAAGNVTVNGDFESPIVNGQSITSWLTNTNTAFVALTGANALQGDQSLGLTGNVAATSGINQGITQSMVGLTVPRGAMTLAFRYSKPAALTAGTLIVRLRSGATTDHLVATVNLATAPSVTDTLVVASGLLDNTVDPQTVRIEITLSGYTGSGTLAIDEVSLAPMVFIDGYWVAIHAAATAFRENDSFTGNTSSADSGGLQTAANQVMGTYFRHTSSGAFWTDS